MAIEASLSRRTALLVVAAALLVAACSPGPSGGAVPAVAMPALAVVVDQWGPDDLARPLLPARLAYALLGPEGAVWHSSFPPGRLLPAAGHSPGDPFARPEPPPEPALVMNRAAQFFDLAAERGAALPRLALILSDGASQWDGMAGALARVAAGGARVVIVDTSAGGSARLQDLARLSGSELRRLSDFASLATLPLELLGGAAVPLRTATVRQGAGRAWRGSGSRFEMPPGLPRFAVYAGNPAVGEVHVEVVRPDGTPVRDGDAGVLRLKGSGHDIWAVADPPPGVWHVGHPGTYHVAVWARREVELVLLEPRPGATYRAGRPLRLRAAAFRRGRPAPMPGPVQVSLSPGDTSFMLRPLPGADTVAEGTLPEGLPAGRYTLLLRLGEGETAIALSAAVAVKAAPRLGDLVALGGAVAALAVLAAVLRRRRRTHPDSLAALLLAPSASPGSLDFKLAARDRIRTFQWSAHAVPPEHLRDFAKTVGRWAASEAPAAEGESLAYFRAAARQLLPPGVRDALAPYRGAHLELVLHPSLYHVPWEALVLPGGRFLCLDFAVSRVFDDHGSPAASRPRRRMLLIADPTGSLPWARREITLLHAYLEKSAPGLELAVHEGREDDPMRLLARMEGYDMVHFAGHSDQQDDPARTGWLLSGGAYLSAADLVRHGSVPALVFSHSCRSGGSGGAEPVGDLAKAYLAGGVEHYVGSLYRVPDASFSAWFAVRFYLELLAGRTVAQSLRQARLDALAHSGFRHFYWASYVLYGPARARLS